MTIMTDADIRGAVARGWCHSRNKHKELDADLANAITEEIANLMNTEEQFDHRVTIWIALCKQIGSDYRHRLYAEVWRSKLYCDGKGINWFVLGMGSERGTQMTYWLPMKLWEETNFADTLDRAPEFDGHTAADVLERIKAL